MPKVLTNLIKPSWLRGDECIPLSLAKSHDNLIEIGRYLRVLFLGSLAGLGQLIIIITVTTIIIIRRG